MKRVMILLVLGLTSWQVGIAQQYGHLNFGNLLAALPETKAADTEIRTLQQQLVQQGEQKALALQEEFSGVIQQIQNGEISPKQQQEVEADFQQKEQELRAFEAEIQQKIAEKREALLTPIIQKVEAAIQAVAQSKGIVMVFDTSVFNAILFAQEADDLMPAVKLKLGIE